MIMHIFRLFVFAALLLFLGCQGGKEHASSHQYTNHLIDETSPYLQQHAHNPVDWYPWGEEALTKAKEENKMLVISVGYAACHWCHVMEHETFEDTAVARLMNEHFVNIKVDREERPDIDDIYMTACQLASEQGCGWPLNAFALPDGRPVWAGTYFPKDEWVKVLEYFIELRETEPAQLEEYAERLAEGVRAFGDFSAINQPSDFSETTTDSLTAQILADIDPKQGGRMGAPKFPLPVVYEYLLHYAQRENSTEAWNAVATTLTEMAAGGIYDQLGGGFARYSTDAAWKVPHFEKMLYDNGQLMSLYAHAYQYEANPLFARVIRETLTFIDRELTSPEGLFYSSLDADSEGEEGTFYVWTQAEIDSLLADHPGLPHVIAHFAISEQGNWESGKNVLDPQQSREAFAAEEGAEALQRLESAMGLLMEARSQRERPGLDNKVLSSWNGMMIKGLVDAYRALGEEEYLQRAVRAGEQLLTTRLEQDGAVWRTNPARPARIQGFLDDYAFTAQAFLSLYEVTYDERWLDGAEQITQYALLHFYDEASGLFYFTSDEDPDLIARRKEVLDNVIPSSNGVMAGVLINLGILLEKEEWKEVAARQIQTVAANWEDYGAPDYFSGWGQLYLHELFLPFEVVVIGEDALAKTATMQRAYLPDALFSGGKVAGSLGLHEGKEQPGKTMIYVCRNKVCKLPVSEPEKALVQMQDWK
jgi:uncharacterized protein YyaL (SSP411 family)